VVMVGTAMLSVPAAGWIGDKRIANAKAYCASQVGAPPTLLTPGYSLRYPPKIEHDSCSFPDPFPGRTFWEGTRGTDGAWTFENLMD
jgi:hypothetical protein